MLPDIKKVLYATDLSGKSAFAFRYAMSFAERQHAEIVILYVLEEISPNTRALLSLYGRTSTHECGGRKTGHYRRMIVISMSRISSSKAAICWVSPFFE